MPATLQKGKGKVTQKERTAMRRYFAKLERKGVRVEDVASATKYSFGGVWSWKNGRSKPDHFVIDFLEKTYGVKVPRVA